MKRFKIMELMKTDEPIDEVLIKGWVRTRRDAKEFSFIEVNDGSCLKNMQVIADADLKNYESIKKLSTGSAVAITGPLVQSQGGGQKWEIKADAIEILSLADDAVSGMVAHVFNVGHHPVDDTGLHQQQPGNIFAQVPEIVGN